MASSSRVYPSEPIAAQTIKLSTCDVYTPKCWMPQFYFWTCEQPDSCERAYEILKLGLGRTLTEFPALAGSLCRLSDDPRDLGVRIDTDSHVEFIHEDLSRREGIPKYATLKANTFPLAGLVEPLSHPTLLSPVHDGSRMIVAKLNRLDGGLVLSFGINHVFADLRGVIEIETIWSMHTADVSNNIVRSHRDATDETEYRKRLSEPGSEAGPFSDKLWAVLPTEHTQLNLPRAALPNDTALTTLEQAKNAMQASCEGKTEGPQMILWKFSPESLVKLKKDAGDSDADNWISTMDALIGLFWSRCAFVRQKGQEKEESALMFVLNFRSRLQPPIKANYVGNAVEVVNTSCSTKLLEAKSGLSAAAKQVRRANSGWKESKWASWLKMANGLPKDQAIVPNPLYLLDTHNMIFNDYSKSLSNVLNWGPELGVVDRTRFTNIEPASAFAGCATAVFANPRLPDGSLEVGMCATEDLKDKLAADEVFSRYGELITVWA